MTNAATSSARLSAGTTPATPGTARTTWRRMALLGLVLVVLGVIALVRDDGGDRVLLAGLGVGAAVRGADLLRAARAGRLSRAAATSCALAAWLGLVAVAVALLSGTAAAWVLTAVLVLAMPALVLGGRRSAPVLAGAAVLVAGAVLLGVLGGTGALLAVGTAVVAVGVTALGGANLLGAVGMRRFARRPAPEPAAGCGGCACGAGGCGSLR
ncbi:hypothetical protein SAMN05661080_01078 [Modestobacter sp. DSM 44400]|uniref:hypothetical protein n=1 Tax=Modestobacter sp. DSM 44400 TaxID=1550230 RepID=UPI000899F44B|nr:hypothetical protein [Modestobacter sp. DSM 44400]SDX75722.1 hypothetical protein SAMN05661080_01078 [Modestobacter sp. DSM 44400]